MFSELVRKFGAAAHAIVGRSGVVNNETGNVGGTPILGVTDGSAAGVWYVGEIISSGISAVTASITAGPTVGVATAASISLTAGAWIIFGSFSFYSAVTNTGLINGGISIYNSTDAADIFKELYITNDIGTANADQGQMNAIGYANLTGTKTILLRIHATNVSGNPSSGGFSTRVDALKNFYAVRIR